MALSWWWPLKLLIKTNLSYALEKKTIIPVKDSRDCESESKGGLYMGISFLRLSSKGKACILRDIKSTRTSICLKKKLSWSKTSSYFSSCHG